MPINDRKILRKFGLTMGIAFLAISLLLLLRHKQAAAPVLFISCIFFLLGFVFPVSLGIVYSLWMKFALAIAWVNTRLILAILFFLIFTPIGMIMRIFKLDPLERKFNKDKPSYWHIKEEKEVNRSNYEKLY